MAHLKHQWIQANNLIPRIYTKRRIELPNSIALGRPSKVSTTYGDTCCEIVVSNRSQTISNAGGSPVRSESVVSHCWRGKEVSKQTYDNPGGDGDISPLSSIPQVRTEACMYEALDKAGIEIHWDCAVERSNRRQRAFTSKRQTGGSRRHPIWWGQTVAARLSATRLVQNSIVNS